jgi:gamma-glutamyl:cysteine ligase YbdK (ATP-grasp superfamily)
MSMDEALKELKWAREFFSHARQRLSEVLAAQGMGLYGAGSHPNAAWLRHKPAPCVHYRQLFDDYQHVARRSLLNGLHVHVGVPADCDRMQLINPLAAAAAGSQYLLTLVAGPEYRLHELPAGHLWRVAAHGVARAAGRLVCL